MTQQLDLARPVHSDVRRRISFWVCTLIATVLLVVGARSILSARKVDSEIDQGRASATLVNADFSSPQEFEVAFEDTYRFHHFIRLNLIHTLPDTSRSFDLKGLKGTVQVVSSPNGQTEPVKLFDGISAYATDAGDCLATLDGSPGTWKLKFVLGNGAESLAGIPHALAITNLSCGCERLVPVGLYVISGACLLGTLVFGVVALVLSIPSTSTAISKGSPPAP